MLTRSEITALYRTHADMVYRVCFTCMRGHRMDAEDALQATFLALIRSGKRFESAAHKKAWLIATAGNTCKNMLKRSHRKDVPLEMELSAAEKGANPDMLCAVLALPERERLCICLHYYEGYTAGEIARIIRCKESTVWGYLHKARARLRIALREDYDERKSKANIRFGAPE